MADAFRTGLAAGSVMKEKLLGYKVLLQFINDSWDSLKQWMLADLRHEESEIRAYLGEALAGLGETLRTDPEFVALLQHGYKILSSIWLQGMATGSESWSPPRSVTGPSFTW